MSGPIFLKYTVLVLLSLGTYTTLARDTLKTHPVAVLVQLRSEHNRIESMKKNKDTKRMEEVIKDANEVTGRIHLDFHNNFDFCPVYYYIDTNAELIKNKQFEGVLLNEDGSKVAHPVINSKSTDYVIAYYGYAISQERSERVVKDSSKYTYDPHPPNGKGLVILNDKFQQVTYFYKLGMDEVGFDLSKRFKKYYYRSKHFDIEYYPLAGTFNRTMLDRYGHRRIQAAKDEVTK